MAKTKTKSRTHHRRSQSKSLPMPPPSAPTLLDEATLHLQSSSPESALPLALQALTLLSPNSPQPVSPSTLTTSSLTAAALPALHLLAQISLAQGTPADAYACFTHIAELDPSDADAPLWLAQLSNEGGEESVRWFERGAGLLRTQISQREGKAHGAAEGEDAAVLEARSKLAQALCGIAEVYMTDLSWDTNAEPRCEAVVTEALLVAPSDPAPLQTLASIRISQERTDEAQTALRRSMALWSSSPEAENGEHKTAARGPAEVPEFASRVSLARLLIEVAMLEEAISVLEGLIAEDDNAVEVWYLGGWALFLFAGKDVDDETNTNGKDLERRENEERRLWNSAREWLRNALKLYEVLEYEDNRLKEHAVELVTELDKALGEGEDDNEDDDDDDDLSDGQENGDIAADNDNDHIMEGT